MSLVTPVVVNRLLVDTDYSGTTTAIRATITMQDTSLPGLSHTVEFDVTDPATIATIVAASAGSARRAALRTALATRVLIECAHWVAMQSEQPTESIDSLTPG